MIHIAGIALAALIGISLGLLGGGGSILTVPILVYVVGFAAKPAIAASLVVVGTTSLVGAIRHWRAGRVRLRTALSFGLVAMAGAYLGARLAAFLSGSAQLFIFAIVMIVAAISMFRRGRSDMEEGGDGPGDAGLAHPALVLPAGLAVGVLTGLVGVGGGFLIVPTLVVLARVPIKHAVGTSLLVISMNCAAGFSGYLGQVDLPWGFLMVFTAVAIGGVLLGSHLVRYASPRALRQAFAVFLVLMGSFILYRNRAAVTSPADAGAPSLQTTRHVQPGSRL